MASVLQFDQDRSAIFGRSDLGRARDLGSTGILRFAQNDTLRNFHALHFQLHFGCSPAALVLRRFGHSDYLGVALEVLAEGAAEDSHAGAVDDADVGESGEEGTVHELLYL
jgi:hypothetical protein